MHAACARCTGQPEHWAGAALIHAAERTVRKKKQVAAGRDDQPAARAPDGAGARVLLKKNMTANAEHPRRCKGSSSRRSSACPLLRSPSAGPRRHAPRSKKKIGGELGARAEGREEQQASESSRHASELEACRQEVARLNALLERHRKVLYIERHPEGFIYRAPPQGPIYIAPPQGPIYRAPPQGPQ